MDFFLLAEEALCCFLGLGLSFEDMVGEEEDGERRGVGFCFAFLYLSIKIE